MKSVKVILFIVQLFLVQFVYSQNLRDITILHWNDLHAQNVPTKTTKHESYGMADSTVMAGGYAYLAAYINKFRNNNSLLMCAGDDFQGSPVSTITKGRSQIELINLLNPDAFSVGNHEFDYSADTLMKNLKIAKFDIVCSNLLDKNSKKPVFKPYKLVFKNGVKVGIVGLTTPELVEVTLPFNIKNVTVSDILIAARESIKQIKKAEKPDLIVVLSHCGIEADEMLADSVPSINVIIGGHSHTLLKTPVKRNKTIICQAGSKGKFLGTLNLKVDVSGDSIVDYNGRAVFVLNSGIIPDPKLQTKVNELEGLVASSMNEVIGELLSNWTRSSRGECNLGNWQTDAIREFTNADIAFQNNGGIRKDLQAGKITIRDIWECNPFGNSIVTFKVRGDSLKMLLEHQVSEAQEKMQVSGLKYSYDPKKPDRSKIVELKINGKPLENSRYYIIGTNNYVVAQSIKFFGFNINSSLVYDTGLIDREVFIEAVRMQKRIDSKIEGRILRIE